MGASINVGIPKWMVMENPTTMNDFGGTSISGNLHELGLLNPTLSRRPGLSIAARIDRDLLACGASRFLAPPPWLGRWMPATVCTVQPSTMLFLGRG